MEYILKVSLFEALFNLSVVRAARPLLGINRGENKAARRHAAAVSLLSIHEPPARYR